VWENLREDIRTIKERDPAARNYVEILLCYPGLHAICLHRIAHSLYQREWYTTARLVSHFNRCFTGIEIHPGAKIGRRLFIDHGMGVVIGETSEIGDDCLIYKGVVLGGTSLVKKKRHPTLGNRVIIGSNSTILGAITIGDGARIGSGSVVVKSVPAGVTVVGVPGRIVESLTPEKEELDFEHGNLPDPLSEIVKMLLQLYNKLEERLKQLENDPEKNRSQ
jgi:serine O-acetyltransferase